MSSLICTSGCLIDFRVSTVLILLIIWITDTLTLFTGKGYHLECAGFIQLSMCPD